MLQRDVKQILARCQVTTEGRCGYCFLFRYIPTPPAPRSLVRIADEFLRLHQPRSRR